ncbi:MAG TPA: haloacid dehalogenase-like hydrolase [Chthoniobacteraceae bacterium]|jgi:phosphoglycolate phosphatase-like HAD superfamily hydrolase
MDPPSASPHAKLILFDIDGTLLTSGGAGERALRCAVQERFGVEDDLKTIEIAGRTDSGIARQVLKKYGLPPTLENVTAFLDTYLHHLSRLLPTITGRLLPGILHLLEALHGRNDVVLGLLTGNLLRGAEIKLTHYGVWHFFEFGAYADDHHDRNELGRFAQRRALEKRGIDFPPADIYVLGDTPHDITCARAIGAKAVAIATGGFSKDQLATHSPDLLFDDLGDVEAVMKALGLGSSATSSASP